MAMTDPTEMSMPRVPMTRAMPRATMATGHDLDHLQAEAADPAGTRREHAG